MACVGKVSVASLSNRGAHHTIGGHHWNNYCYYAINTRWFDTQGAVATVSSRICGLASDLRGMGVCASPRLLPCPSPVGCLCFILYTHLQNYLPLSCRVWLLQETGNGLDWLICLAAWILCSTGLLVRVQGSTASGLCKVMIDIAHLVQRERGSFGANWMECSTLDTIVWAVR